MRFEARLYRLGSYFQDDHIMLIFTVCTIAIAIVISLALAASASPTSAMAAIDPAGDDEHVRPLNMAPKPFTTTHAGVDQENRPVVSAAGLQ
jgi:hypothetical protein